MEYRDKLVLAPMVRVCTLPMRLLALDYGADIVYCEEIIDFKMLRSKRIENSVLGTVDFVTDDGTLAFRTCSQERGKVVFQLGTSDPQRALQVARLVEKDVAAIDINMGCPKEFSIRGGMGAALLKKPQKVKEILTTLVQGLSIPVTCKIRLLPTLEETIALAQLIESSGVSALGLHGRTQHERTVHPNHNDMIKAVAQKLSIPVIANGGSREIKRFDDIAKFRNETGASSVMLARAIQWNPSILRREGFLPIEDVIKSYLKYAIDYDSVPMNAKYCVQQLMREDLESPKGKALLASGSLKEFCAIWGMTEYYNEVQLKQADITRGLKRGLETGDVEQVKKVKLDDGTELYDLPLRYNRRDYGVTSSPKMVLYQWSVLHKMEAPKYSVEYDKEMKVYCATLTFDDVKYRSSAWDKSKKFAEQATACLCLRMLGILDGRLMNNMPELPPELSGRQQSLTDKQSAGQTENKTREAQVVEDTHIETVESRKVIDSNGTRTTCIHEHDLSDSVQKRSGDGVTHDSRGTSDNAPCVAVVDRLVLTSTLPVSTDCELQHQDS